MKRSNQKGSALLFTLILVLVLSVMAASLMFLARSETWSSMNYRMMTKARYGAEAGVNAAANFLMSTNYVAPMAVPPFPSSTFTGYDTTKYPLQLAGGGNVYLSTLSGQPSTYPDAAMQAAYANAVNGSLQAGASTVNYTASAQLMSMVTIVPFGTTTPMTIQTWQITAHGDITSVRNAEAEVVTILERYISPAFAYAAFAVGNNCAQLSFTGNGQTDSYDSNNLTLSGGVIQAPTGNQIYTFGGNVGTNGNQTLSGSQTTVYGTLSTPNAGTGVCSSGSMTALTGNLSQVTGGLVQLPSAVTFPTPTVYPPGTTNINMNSGQQTLGPCNVAPCSYGTITLGGGNTKNPTNLILTPGTYNIDSLAISGNAEISIGPDPVTGQYGPVVLNVAGSNNNPLPIAIAGNAINNPTYDPSLFQITYAGTGTVQVAGNGASAAVVYAPNATVDFKGNGAFYGSAIANQILDVGNGSINYDLKLKKRLFTVGNYALQSFTWNKF